MSDTITVPMVDDADLARELTPGSGFVAVDFTAAWCAPCRLMTPLVEALAGEYAPRLRVLQIDADANPASLARYGVRGLPTLLLFNDGALVGRVVGAISKSALRERVERALGA